jgi:hypothetical protein
MPAHAPTVKAAIHRLIEDKVADRPSPVHSCWVGVRYHQPARPIVTPLGDAPLDCKSKGVANARKASSSSVFVSG